MRKFFGTGQKGFTLIELLIVIAILGVLAGVAVPNLSRFMNSGKHQAAITELANVQTATQAMMVDQNVSSLPATLAANSNDMTHFPVTNSASLILYGGIGGNYMQTNNTTYKYSCDTSGTVTQIGAP